MTKKGHAEGIEEQKEYWDKSSDDLIQYFNASKDKGLTSKEANSRLIIYGKNTIKSANIKEPFSLFIAQFKSPIIIIFIFTSILSFFLGQTEDALIIISIVILSGTLGFWQEKGATDAISKLLAIVQLKTTVLRDRNSFEIPVEDVVPGDILMLKSGDSIPADCLIIESKDLFVNESTLTGESYPVDKSAGILSKETPLRKRINCIFMGTFVISGTAKVLVIKTGTNTELGKISNRLRHKVPETEFERGIKRFGYFLMEITLMLVISILVINVYFHRPVLESFLFSLALSIGLTPQLLPAIIGVNLAHGAKKMAKEKVIVKRLEAIENLGSMNILCSDKTGTLTIGQVKLQSAIDTNGGINNEMVLFYGYINSVFETGFTNPIDKAIKEFCFNKFDVSEYKKLDEIPYDFVRKRISILVSFSVPSSSKKKLSYSTLPHTRTLPKSLIITKGALYNILDICTYAKLPNGHIVEMATIKQEIVQRFEEYGNKGYRVLGLCYRDVSISVEDDEERINGKPYLKINKSDETSMTFLGFLVFYDPLKPEIIESVNNLRKLGISLKIITGDNKHVASFVGEQLGLSNSRILTGPDLYHMSNDALANQAEGINIFAEIEPNQKEQIIFALRQKEKNVVGYLGDGINDASALHAADAGISVDTAADVVKEAADFVLLEKDLNVISKGIQEGRRTFANTLKYIFMATSANFGNMFSMAGASLFLPFLPLLPKQILLLNLMTDMPEMTISTDNVDAEIVEKPRRLDIKFIRKFMVVFGLLSTIFDYITFGIFYLLLHSDPVQLRTSWLIESVVSASMVILIIRTRKPFFKSKPKKHLLVATLTIVSIAIMLPFTPIAEIFGFKVISFLYMSVIGVIVILYIVMAEIVKKIFYKRIKF
ncbi:MAG: magnesium-translocating P-type ATPase [Candidatus Nitrosocosmicus sp.]